VVEVIPDLNHATVVKDPNDSKARGSIVRIPNAE